MRFWQITVYGSSSRKRTYHQTEDLGSFWGSLRCPAYSALQRASTSAVYQIKGLVWFSWSFWVQINSMKILFKDWRPYMSSCYCSSYYANMFIYSAFSFFKTNLKYIHILRTILTLWMQFLFRNVRRILDRKATLQHIFFNKCTTKHVMSLSPLDSNISRFVWIWNYSRRSSSEWHIFFFNVFPCVKSKWIISMTQA